MSMKLLLSGWLAPESHDPLRDTRARLLQRFALVMLAAALLSLPVSLVAQSTVERLIGLKNQRKSFGAVAAWPSGGGAIAHVKP
jgi:hypothetical protein